MRYGHVAQIAEHLVRNLEDSCLRIQTAGSFLRKKAECGDLEIICIPRPGRPRPEFGQTRIYTSWLDLALHHLECDGFLGRRIKDGDKYKQISIATERYGLVIPDVFVLDLFIVRPDSWGVQLMIRTGPADFSHRMVTNKKQGGALPDDMKVADGLLWKDGQVVPTLEEADFFEAIGLPRYEPEVRV
jgi:DNA polymerase/3'-5' exonuclease PolX